MASGTIVDEGLSGFGRSGSGAARKAARTPAATSYDGHASPDLVPVGAHASAGQPIADVGCGIRGHSSAPGFQLGMLATGGDQPLLEMPSVGETSHESLPNLKTSYSTALAAYRKAQAARRARGAAHKASG